MLHSSKLLWKGRYVISHGRVSWTMRKALPWEVIYTLKTTEELWVKHKGGETGKKHNSQHHITESACTVIQFAVFNEANINTFILFLTVLINPNSVTRALASSIHYVILKSTVIKVLKALPLHIKNHHGDCVFTTMRAVEENLMAKKASSYKAKSIMGWFSMTIFSCNTSQYWNQCSPEIKRFTFF